MSDEPDLVTAELAAIRERWDTAQNGTWQDYATALELLSPALRSAADVPRLLAAAEAVLKPHQPGRTVILGDLCGTHEGYRYFSITAVEAAGVRACPDCAATVYTACAGCFASPPFERCAVRSAITTELTGKDGT